MKTTDQQIERLKELREKLHLSKSEMSRQLGYKEGHVNSIENGERNISTSFLKKMEKAYGISIDWILYGKGELKLDIPSKREVTGLAERIKKLRGNDSYQEMSDLTGVSVFMLREAELGNRIPSDKLLRKVAEAYDTGFEYLAYGDENAKEYPVNEKMIEYLKKNPDVRKMIYLMMR